MTIGTILQLIFTIQFCAGLPFVALVAPLFSRPTHMSQDMQTMGRICGALFGVAVAYDVLDQLYIPHYWYDLPALVAATIGLLVVTVLAHKLAPKLRLQLIAQPH